MTTRIKSRHPVREAVSSHSSGSRYNEPQDWWDKVVAELHKHGFTVAETQMPTTHTFEGRGLVTIFGPNGEDTGCCLCYTWYTEGINQPNGMWGNWELVGYIT